MREQAGSCRWIRLGVCPYPFVTCLSLGRQRVRTRSQIGHLIAL
ncbi:hypothetical protein RB11798 [Rhodopirellula baltica SH 1]|uniref:Uncharacterized protein n=1 Tax=Rhodopirellula baltica (strain DSM 10527 / NCIMB 13988 / SH1) TaxID=243090 RepID=Q7UDU6_RHOBA|nr:hypothetical protein RB11798 [Rhodopirellula baltica SH 1]